MKMLFQSLALPVLAAAILGAAGCSKAKKTEAQATQADHAAEPSRAPSTPVAVTTPAPQSKPLLGAQDENDFGSVYSGLATAPDKLALVSGGWNALTQPEFDEPVTDPTALQEIVSGSAAPLHAELRNPDASWAGTEFRRAVTRRLALCVALLSSSELGAATLPDLFRDRVQQPAVTEGDLLSLRIVEQASQLIEKRSAMPEDRMPGWLEMAASPNPVYRIIAMKGFALTAATPDQANRFFSSYLTEVDPAVARVLIEQLTAQETRRSLEMLTQFRGQANRAGVIAEAEEGIAALKERVR
jgi:hypothetical protein